MLINRVLKPYQIMRFIVFLDPQVDPQGAGWNLLQSVTAVGSGGLAGKGFLKGTQSHYQFLPQQSTDFIFSILAEEWGFLGGLLVFGLFLVILLRGVRIMYIARDDFGMHVAAGVVGMIFFHVVINIGMAMGIMPITGIPLFFLSYGGSSLWTALIGVGLLLDIYFRRYGH
jgi:rod shape determining protein RodA